ncbi:MAG: transcription antitermination factor NusB [Sulfobacillus thermosulfidooxidans]|uniref:Transcription antitermination protein NusB n=1 Tax=Sulfobacillus thermotolerans TaxID=338644 RepID=A0ABN5GZG3_9FIRM|nr:transcription antitermination factor NusB [Sulfobacillus thermotolerans]PSR35645.1 MAG: transcription antitermination factor NusB [Sulfobacillus thermosulfidooxidans]
MARHHAREEALKILFEHDLAQTGIEILLKGLHEPDTADREFAQSLVQGVVQQQAELDAVIAQAAVDWKIQRMPTIDRNVLRMAVYELYNDHNTPISVIISEALELAGEYSTDDAKRFVNGVLSAVAKQIRPEGDLDRIVSEPADAGTSAEPPA